MLPLAKAANSYISSLVFGISKLLINAICCLTFSLLDIPLFVDNLLYSSLNLEKQISQKRIKALRKEEYKRKKGEIRLKEIGSKEYQKEKRENRSFFTLLLLPIGISVVMLLVGIVPDLIKKHRTIEENNDLQDYYTEAQELMNNNKFDQALQRANMISPSEEDNSEWDEKRESLINEINKKKMEYEIENFKSKGKKVKAPEDSDDLEGENYEDVVKQLKEAGFKFVRTETIADVVIGLFDDVGEVEKISINGKTSFDKGDKFPEESEVVVTYHIE